MQNKCTGGGNDAKYVSCTSQRLASFPGSREWEGEEREIEREKERKPELLEFIQGKNVSLVSPPTYKSLETRLARDMNRSDERMKA